MRKSNRYLEALKEQYNVVGLASAAALSAATVNPLPLLAALVAEAAYLVFVPDSKWYDARLAKRFDAEVARRREQLKARILPTLRPEVQERFTRLEETRQQIQAQPMEGQKWFREVLRKLDYLLEKFLMFAGKEAEFRAYLRSVREEVCGPHRGGSQPAQSQGPRRDASGTRSPAARSQPPSPSGQMPVDGTDRWIDQMVGEVAAEYDREMEALRQKQAHEQDANTTAVLEKRLEVLQRRHEFVGKIGRILTNLNHQLHLLEDTFGLINDEIRARSPEQVLSDIEEVVWQTETMTRLLEEVAPYEQAITRMTG